MTYSEKLKDTRWQRRRLEILQRDEFKCQLCWSEDKTLHVHHAIYSRDPWEAKDDDLLTVCEDCHGEIEVLKKNISADLSARILNSPHTGLSIYQMFYTLAHDPDGANLFFSVMAAFQVHPEFRIVVENVLNLVESERFKGFNRGLSVTKNTQSHTQGSQTVQDTSKT